jgi:hypothetical protein
MPAIPTQAELRAALGLDFVLSAPGCPSVSARLSTVEDGIAMDDGYLCYSAVFDLPPGAYLPQDLYHVAAPSGAAWELLVTPTRPKADGAATMCAVFHIARPAEVSAG